MEIVVKIIIDLNLHKVSARWVPQMLNTQQKENHSSVMKRGYTTLFRKPKREAKNGATQNLNHRKKWWGEPGLPDKSWQRYYDMLKELFA